MAITRHWHGRWINGETLHDLANKVAPAPYLRKTFQMHKTPGSAVAYVCAPGWHEIYVNGQKVDDRVLAPTVTQFDQHVSYIAYDILPFIRQGKNAIVALLGNGLYNCHTKEIWNFSNAYWRDFPKLICDVVVDGAIATQSDASWKTITSPIRFDAIRNGEHYDCTCEIPDVSSPDLDDSAWNPVNLCAPPAGIPILEELEPTKVCRTYPLQTLTEILPGTFLADFGTALTGWLRLTLENDGSSAEKPHVSIQYTELKRWNDGPDSSNISTFIYSGECQTDHVYLRPQPGTTTFEPRFTYHGFRYAYVTIHTPGVKIQDAQACFVHNDFPQIGTFNSSHDMLNRLQQATVQSYLANFTGIPTDCPHREKNGWTGDAQLAMETGLWNFNATKAYSHFMQVFADTQRPSGQFPGIAPTAGCGYNWGSGPAWDSLIFETAWQLRRYRGDDTVIRNFYPNMKRYLQYCQLMANDNLVSFGLGDWCPLVPEHMPATKLTSSAYVYADAVRFAAFAKLLGNREDQQEALKMAQDIKKAIQKEFDHGSGIWDNDSWTALGCVLYYDFCTPEQAQPLADRLVEKVRMNDHKVDFGILGAKWVPRVLADYGYAEDAFKLITQPEFPGWGNWIRRGATTLWETWTGDGSLLHIMFGDISAWMYEYLAGVSPDVSAPGFKAFTVKPNFITQLNFVTMDYQTPNGNIHVDWKRKPGGVITLKLTVPEGSTATVILPRQSYTEVSGTSTYEI